MNGVTMEVKEPVEDTQDRLRVAIETHGCKLNRADSESLARQFSEAGYEVVSADERAEVYVLNTCTVTHVADRKARQWLRSAKRSNPDALVVATGCYVQRNPKALLQMPQVGLVSNNDSKPVLVSQVSSALKESPVPCATGADDGAAGATVEPARTRAMIKIQEGCDQVCAYCIVPKVRGRERSVPPDEVLRQVRSRVAEGYREVVLTGTQLGSYGFDLDGVNLESLVGIILDETDIQRLRISSLQPQEITEGLLGLWSDSRLCPHFHIPLQSGSDRVLRLMRRRYTARLYAEKVEQIRERVPDVAITTDVLVGFPGETERDFVETYDLCGRAAFSSLHVFPYSTRPGTSAAYLSAKVDPSEKSRRLRAMLELSTVLSHQYRQAFLGETRPVLWESKKPLNGLRAWTGLTDNYIRVYATADAHVANRITRARLISISNDNHMIYCEVAE